MPTVSKVSVVVYLSVEDQIDLWVHDNHVEAKNSIPCLLINLLNADVVEVGT